MGVMGQPTVNDILNELWVHPDNAEWTPKIGKIALSRIKDWMNSNDIEVLGFVCSTIDGRRFQIEPELSLQEYVDFYQLYYGRCLRESPGWDLVNVIASLWRQSGVPRSVLEGWKKWLAEQYRDGSEEVRKCIIQATLEHLLEQKHFRKSFEDWKKDPVLRHAYEEALLWHEGGGETPLGRPPLI